MTGPRLGVVIGTYASVPYIELQLACRDIYWRDVPVLVCDDSSMQGDLLRNVSNKYHSNFITTPQRYGHIRGDMAVFVNGLTWAAENNIEVLVKISRRFIFTSEWSPHLRELASVGLYPTYSNPCGDTHLPLRSECIAMHVKSWMQCDVYSEMQDIVNNGPSTSFMMEHWCYDACRRVYEDVATHRVRHFDKIFSRSENWRGYGLWPTLGFGRYSKSDRYLWHDVDLPEDYYEMALQVGLTEYSLHDFRDPNRGAGRSKDWSHNKVDVSELQFEKALDRPCAQQSFEHSDGIVSNTECEISQVNVGSVNPFAHIDLGLDAWKAGLVSKKARHRNYTMPWNTYNRLLRFVPSANGFVRVQDPDGRRLIGRFCDTRFMESVTTRRFIGPPVSFIARRLQEMGGTYFSICGNCNGFTQRLAHACPTARYVFVEDDLLNAQAVAMNSSLNGPRKADVWHATNLRGLSLDSFIAKAGYDDITLIRIDVDDVAETLLRSLALFLSNRIPEIVFEFDPERRGSQGLNNLIAAGYFLTESFGYELNLVHEDGSFSPFPDAIEPQLTLVHAARR